MSRRTFACSLFVASALVLGSACGDSGGDSDADSTTVEIVDDAFSPAAVRVKAGTTVSWTWKGQNTHSVAGAFDGQDFFSGDHTRADGFTASHLFRAAGTYEYVCGFHGGSMKGIVTVE